MLNAPLVKTILTSTLLLLPLCSPATGQTPSAASSRDATRQDATRPPATQPQRSPQDNPAHRPASDPTAPPGVDRPLLPQEENNSRAETESGALNAGNGASEKDASPSLDSLLEAHPLPPLPSLKRLSASSDKTMPLTLNETIRLALENNNDIDFARHDVRYNETLLRASEAVYDPLISFTPQIDYRVQPLTDALNDAAQGSARKVTDINLNPSLTKLFRTGGGQYQFFFNNTREETNSGTAQVNPFYSASLGVQLTQPLLRNRAIDLNRRTIRIQRKQLAQSDAEFRRQVMDIIVQVQRAYWDLVFALRDQQNRNANLKLARELFRQTEQRITAGAVAPLERAEVQTELSSRESDVIESTENVSIAENRLKQLILRDPQAPEWSAALVPTDEPSFDDTAISLSGALEESRANRPELSRLRLQQEINDIDLQYFRDQTRPRVDLQATVSTTGLAGSLAGLTNGSTGGGTLSNELTPLINGSPATNADAYLLTQINQLRAQQGLPNVNAPLVASAEQIATGNLGGYGRLLRNLFSLQTRNIVVGLTIELPFGNHRAQANLAGVRIQREQLASTLRTQEQAIEMEVRNAAQALETARQRVLTARNTRRNAELQLSGERRLYEVGQSTTFLLFQRENSLTNARNLELRAQTDYHKALANLQRATSTTLHANHVVVETLAGR